MDQPGKQNRWILAIVRGYFHGMGTHGWPGIAEHLYRGRRVLHFPYMLHPTSPHPVSLSHASSSDNIAVGVRIFCILGLFEYTVCLAIKYYYRTIDNQATLLRLMRWPRSVILESGIRIRRCLLHGRLVRRVKPRRDRYHDKSTLITYAIRCINFLTNNCDRRF
jgi:hypothetical protein